MAVRLATLVLISLFLLVPDVNSQQSVPILVKNSHRGFSKQYGEILKAFRKADRLGVQSAFDTFKLPTEWFTESFGPDLGPTLAKQYEVEFESFVTATEKLYGSVYEAGVNTVDTHRLKVDARHSPNRKTAPTSLIALPQLQYFEVDYGRPSVTGRDSFEAFTVFDWGWSKKSTGTFVYVDGAFRFFGSGTYPFWDSPELRLNTTCSESSVEPGIPITPLRLLVRAFVTEVARKYNLHGTVELNITVAPSGSVERVDVLSGEPKLSALVQNVATHTFYFPPFRKCGQPVEGVAKEVVDVAKP